MDEINAFAPDIRERFFKQIEHSFACQLDGFQPGDIELRSGAPCDKIINFLKKYGDQDQGKSIRDLFVDEQSMLEVFRNLESTVPSDDILDLIKKFPGKDANEFYDVFEELFFEKVDPNDLNSALRLKEGADDKLKDFLEAMEDENLAKVLGKVDGSGVRAWEALSINGNAVSHLIRQSSEVLVNVDKLLSTGIIDNLDLELFIDALNLLKNKNIPDEDLIEIAEYAFEASKYSGQWAQYGIETDILGQLYKLANSPNFKNPRALKKFLKKPGLAATIKNNPGTLEQLNEAVKLLEEGKDIKLEDLIKDGDIVNLTDGESIQIKAYTGTSSLAFKDNLKKAADQFNSEIGTK